MGEYCKHNGYPTPRIKDKFGTLAIDLVPSDDPNTKAAIRKAQGLASIAKADIVYGTIWSSVV